MAARKKHHSDCEHYPESLTKLWHDTEAAYLSEIERLRKCLKETRHEICAGPRDDTLWHTEMPSCTTVDNITLTLDDDWDYAEWMRENAA